MMKKLIVAALVIAGSSASSIAQDVQKGTAVFNVCLACHAIGPGAQNKIGPELNGLDGRTAGTVPNFDYSDANKSSGIVWNEATFEEYIKSPGEDPRHQNDLSRHQERAAGQRFVGLRESIRRERQY
jgi:cytochrome c